MIKHYSEEISGFRNRSAPEPGLCVGYLAIIKYYDLNVPLPDRLCIISKKHKKYETDSWLVFEPKYKPEDSLAGNLIFALKYEGIDLCVLNSLFKTVSNKEIENIILKEPVGKYSRKIWFLYEWLTDNIPAINDLNTGNYIDLVDEKLQYAGRAVKSRRHKINNNLPGVRNFCPMIRKTLKLENFITENLDSKLHDDVYTANKELIARTSAFLLLKDTKASFAIEGESPSYNRILRWGRALSLAGKKEIEKNELIRLQEIVLGDSGFSEKGYRKEGGFVGEHDRQTGSPLPDHICAKPGDIAPLIDGLLESYRILLNSSMHPVLAATLISFGFVFIHPFVDGNGRIHRFLINDALIKKGFIKDDFVFPVSSVLLEKIAEYRKALEYYSLPRMEFIEWIPTQHNNVEVLNDTAHLYSFFDATKQAEFLFECVRHTVEITLPEEIRYLKRHDKMKNFLNNKFDIPDKLIDIIIRFLEQNGGKFSERAKKQELKIFSGEDLESTEMYFRELT